MLRRRQLFVSCFMSIAASTLCFAFLYMLYRPKVMTNVDVITIVEKAINRYFGDRGVLSSSNKKTSDILVIGYLRGGTTFIGEILGLRNDSFYVYEPLHKMAEFGYFKPGHECSMYNETCRKSNKTDCQVLNVIRAINNCDYSHYNDQIRTWQQLKSRGIESLKDPKWNISFPECNGT
ncbi:uncharacterized protein LOC110449396 [Mizuhopecten yessoensis]|uniref:uncharacterized protein LOC110449396 n=1 Tax=Mizuhopecten yessoensis TaxID=6573 RepID=UPI000B45CAB4|nr:uncharacterized protein LOC110449396 [Mizuhopecten yessoensis]